MAPLYLNNTHRGKRKISQSPLEKRFCCYRVITVPTRGVQRETRVTKNLPASCGHESSRKAAVQLLRAHPSCVFRVKPHLQGKRNTFNLHKRGSLCVFPLSWEPDQHPRRSAHERCESSRSNTSVISAGWNPGIFRWPTPFWLYRLYSCQNEGRINYKYKFAFSSASMPLALLFDGCRDLHRVP